MSNSITYPLCQRFSLSYSSFEDRLILAADRPSDSVKALLTRSITIKIMTNLLTHLPLFTQLDKMPRALWQEALNISHQQALNMEKETKQAFMQQYVQSKTFNVQQTSQNTASETKLFLVTEVQSQRKDNQLLLGFSGLPLPDALTIPQQHSPIFALALESQHLHQLLQLFLNKATEAQWNIPFDLPWTMDTLSEQPIYSH